MIWILRLVFNGFSDDSQTGQGATTLLTGEEICLLFSKVKTLAGYLVHANPLITQAFCEFYANPYNIQGELASLTPDEKCKRILHYLGQSILPKLTIKALETNLTAEEFYVIVKSKPSGKAPRPAGFTTLYYKTFCEIVIPPLTSYANAIKKEGLRFELHITVIPKPG